MKVLDLGFKGLGFRGKDLGFKRLVRDLRFSCHSLDTE